MASYTKPNINLEGKKIIVTGAGRGIGRDISEKLFEHGAIVYAISRTKSYLDTLKAKCPTIVIFAVDLENWDETRKVVESIGPVDGVVNNAGVLKSASLLESSFEDYEKIWKTNVCAVLNISQVVAKGMIQMGKGGSIVNISSNGVNIGVPTLSLYASSKAALDRLTKSMANEWGQYKIRANTINPHYVETDMTTEILSNPEAVERIVSRIPLGRILKSEDVTNSVLFMLSDLSSMISGENIAIDGAYRCY